MKEGQSTKHPGGRPRKLTPAQERQVYEVVTATRWGFRRRYLAYRRLSDELHVGVSTLERIVGEQRRFHENIETLLEGIST